MSTITKTVNFILLNACHGSFCIPTPALAVLRERYPDDRWDSGYEDRLRTDPRVISLFRENKALFKSFCTELYCQKIAWPAMKAKAYTIEEYDGSENLRINWDKVTTYKTRKILNDESLSDSDKLKQLKALIR